MHDQELQNYQMLAGISTLDEMRQLIEPEYEELLEAAITELDMLELL